MDGAYSIARQWSAQTMRCFLVQVGYPILSRDYELFPMSLPPAYNSNLKRRVLALLGGACQSWGCARAALLFEPPEPDLSCSGQMTKQEHTSFADFVALRRTARASWKW